jgi:hypothetical protein
LKYRTAKDIDDLPWLLKQFQSNLEDGWGIEVSKRLCGITVEMARILEQESLEFRIIKDHFKKNRSRAEKAKLNLEAELKKRQEMSLQFLKETTEKLQQSILPIGETNQLPSVGNRSH